MTDNSNIKKISSATSNNSSCDKQLRILSSLENPKGENLTNLSRELKELSASIRNTRKRGLNIKPKPTQKEKIAPIEPIATDNSNSEAIFEYTGGDYFSLEQIENQEGNNTQIEIAISAINEAQQSRLNTSATDMLSSGSTPIIEEDESVIDESYFTESLAYIYIKQKKYLRAIEIIKYLSLKFPEKNIYFADQIRFLEKLIINIKN